jgi:hypothetical protein
MNTGTTGFLMTHNTRLLTLLFFASLYGLGLTILGDYGFATDEPINRENGGVTLRYLLSIIENITGTEVAWGKAQLAEFHSDLFTYKDRDYGVAFDLPAMILERILDINASRDQYLLRHALTHLVFIGSLATFYLTIKDRFQDRRLAFIGVALMICSPRIYSESFYNNKDIVFMSLFLIALFFSLRFLKNPTIKYCLWAALFTALAINVRIIAVILPAITVVASVILILNKDILLRRSSLLIFAYFICVVLLVFCFWPWLWTDPFSHFIEAFRNMAKFRWINWVLYNGHYYPSTNLPWHYLPIWIVVTTPVAYIVLGVLGVIAILREALQKGIRRQLSVSGVTDLIFVSILVVPTCAAIALKSTLYDGWRQFYFIYPALIYVAVCGYVSIERLFHSSRIVRSFVITLILIYVIAVAIWMMRNHPFQNVYFNFLAGPKWIEKFEGDYWGLTNTAGLQFIANSDSRANIYIFGLGNTSIPQALLMLPKDMQARFTVVYSIEQADYILTNFRLLNRSDDNSLLKSISEKLHKFYTVEVDQNIIFAVYKTNR